MADKRTKLAVNPSLIKIIMERYPEMTITAAINHHLAITLTEQSTYECQGKNIEKRQTTKY
jgi:hypothetical protein